MKTVDQYRRTDQFKITSSILSYMVEVSEFLIGQGESLVCICFAEENKAEDSIDLYAVRVGKGKEVWDRLIRANSGVRPCEVLESVLIGK